MEISRLLHVAGFTAIFFEANYLIGARLNPIFIGNLPCFVAALYGISYVS